MTRGTDHGAFGGDTGDDIHVVDELPRLLSGEASQEVVGHAAAHLRGCPDCQQELVATVVAHASLTSAHRFAPEVVARPRLEPSTPDGAGDNDLPDLQAVFAQVRAEAADAPDTALRGERTRGGSGLRRGLLAAAAVAGLLIGGGGVALISHDNGKGTTQQASGRLLSLRAYGEGTHAATARIRADGTMTIDASGVPTPPAGQRYEVWLTTATRGSMQPVGWIGSDGHATLSIPANLMQRYAAIEVSVQSIDTTDYGYSGRSILRGTYA